MPYTLSDDELLIQKTVREFAQSGIGLEKAVESDRFDRFPAGPLAEAAALGLTALAAPPELGGAGGTALALALDEVAQVCPNTAAVLAVHNTALRLAADAGRADLAKRLAAGELAALLATEEASGSDTASLGTVAKPDAASGGFRVTGQKVWGIAASDAKHLLALAQVPGRGAALLHVPAEEKGITLGRNEPLLGLRAAGIRSVYLSNAAAPKGALIGEPGKAQALLAGSRPWLQVAAAACLTGCVAGAAEAAMRFAETRVQFGQPIGTYQAVSDGVAQMDVQLAAARSLTLAAAARLGTPEAAVWASRAKAFAAEMAIPMTRLAIRIQGGTGFMREGGTERFARDARALQFLGETVHMQRDLLKRHLLPGIQFPATP